MTLEEDSKSRGKARYLQSVLSIVGAQSKSREEEVSFSILPRFLKELENSDAKGVVVMGGLSAPRAADYECSSTS